MSSCLVNTRLLRASPSLDVEGATGRYRDSIELASDDARVLTSRHLGADGAWHAFMTMRYRRIA